VGFIHLFRSKGIPEPQKVNKGRVPRFYLPQNTTLMSEKFHIGKFIQSKMEEDGRKAKWLAKKINCHRNNIYKIYQQEHINPELLIQISIHLNLNLFSHYFEYVNAQIQKESCKM
jgi:hypothetical protein